ncbi:SDR family NAD(P)-dependent oxidoreductase [Streptomyces sp. MBT62]|uniref:SDR family NAD(P)-dependent oxidoreductase n=1 Tax=Streptomyces sp. MBT62 TaxID=2800410 RepID=UPI001909DD36|nr:SDR family NAD(P)-dependent oxidoreductase [Streptomyces sp. MBT62]MBK3562882.1 SDR family oxidoreductase [Streptomyces sp. MBT62]
MPGELTEKVAIITGGAGGIGRATAERFVAEGARVVIADVDARAGTAFARTLGDHAAFRRTDVADAQQVRQLVDFTADHFGGLHVMCNIAGVSGSLRRFLDDDLRDFQQVMSVDLFGVMTGSRCAALHMVEHGGGVIINVSSAAGIDPGTGMLPYRAAKAGVAHFTRCLAVELGEHGVRANCVAPANIATDINAAFDKAAVTRLQPLPRQGRPDDVAEAVLYLASDRAAQVTGVVLPVDGGMSTGTPQAPAGGRSPRPK